jgi:hypothetical protein
VEKGKMKRNIYFMLIFLGILVLVGCGKNQNARNNDAENQMARLPTVDTASPTAARATWTPTPKSIQYNPTTPPTVTPKPTNTVTPTVIFENKVIIFKVAEGGVGFYIVDSLEGKGRPLSRGGNLIYDILDWKEGCTLHAITKTGIAKINLNGQVTQEIFNFLDQWPNNLEGYWHYFNLSPDNKWLSYRIGTGEFHDSPNLYQVRYDFENIYAQSVDGESGPYQVSSGGDALISAWSPDSRRLAYGDVNEAGIHQVYAVNPDGSHRDQLTNFVVDSDIEGLQWSPESKQLAIEFWLSDDSSKRDILIVSDTEHQQTDRYPDLQLLWWKDENILLVYERQGDLKGIIKQLDVNSGQIIDSAQVNSGGIHFAPFGSQQKVGFINNDGYFSVYDTERHTVTDLHNISVRDSEMRDYLGMPGDMIVSPDSFTGESECPRW